MVNFDMANLFIISAFRQLIAPWMYCNVLYCPQYVPSAVLTSFHVDVGNMPNIPYEHKCKT